MKVRTLLAWVACGVIGCSSASGHPNAEDAGGDVPEASQDDEGRGDVVAASYDGDAASPGMKGDALELEASSDDDADRLDAVSEGGTRSPDSDAGACSARVQRFADEGAGHVPVCSAVTYGTNPPSSGNHYGTWASYRTYDKPVPRGFWVHNLEHGAIVISYNCPQGCDADLLAAKAFVASLPPDPVCLPSGVRQRVILTPDPLLDTRIAASAWGVTLRANCFDVQAFRAFYDENYSHGLELVCGDGVDVFAGGTAACP